jgi:hypothetical protein
MPAGARVGPKHVTPAWDGVKKLKRPSGEAASFFYALRTKRPGVSGDGVATQLGTNSTVGS